MRGAIQNRERARQLRDFTGLQFGKITPTDIDGFLDFHNKLFVYIEAKVAGEQMPVGQRLALERQCIAAGESGKRRAAVLVIEHNTPAEQDIDFANCPVCELRFSDEEAWREPMRPIACREAIAVLLKQAGIDL